MFEFSFQESEESMAEQESDWGLKWELLVADAWADPELKQRLVKEPKTVLKERGISPPPGKQFKVVEETEDTVHLIIPPKPEEEELSEEQLEAVAGGGSCCGGGGGGYCGGGGYLSLIHI